MVFSSSVFLFVFLPIVLLLYFAIPTRPAKNVLLLAVSLVFYAWGEPVYVLLMIVSIISNWGFARLIDTRDNKRLFLVLCLIVDLGILGFYKYEGFFAENINILVGSQVLPDLNLPLPIGISFYTLQAVSYIIDVYRGEVASQRNPLYLGMYIAMFPQLIAGPIVRYQTIEEQVVNRHENVRDFVAGARLFTVGLAKKVLLANIVAILAGDMLELGGSNIGAVGAWGGLIAFTFQIFFDFSGYSDMAIGLGKMFGFRYLRNFNYPYISRSISEFWRRWHISLGSFFRDYVYISMGGNRCSKPRWILNLTVVWALTGFWHGAAWNYIFWGLYNLAFLLLEKVVYGKALARCPRWIQHVYAIVAFTLGWLVFWVEDMGSMLTYFLALFGAYGVTGTQTMWELGVWMYVPVFVVCVIASTPIVPWLRSKLVSWVTGDNRGRFMKVDLPHVKYEQTDTLCDYDGYLDRGQALSRSRANVFSAAMLAVDAALLFLLLASVFSVVSGSFNPFIYFRF